MAELTYREAVASAIAQEMDRDERVVLFGEDVGRPGGVYGATQGLFASFGPSRVLDMPISEQAIVGVALGAAMTGLLPIAEIMYSDFLAVCWDQVANQVAKARYMTAGQVDVPLVLRTANGFGLRYGAQHSQSVENWAMAIPGLRVVAPSNAADAKGLLAASIRHPDPVVFFEHKALYGESCEVPGGEFVDELGTARVLRRGRDLCIVALAAMVPRAVTAADILDSRHGISASVIDLRSLVPLDTATVYEELARTRRLVTVEENPRLCGWGAELASLVVEERFELLAGPIVRITTPHVPLPCAPTLEDHAVPTVERIVESARRSLDAHDA